MMTITFKKPITIGVMLLTSVFAGCATSDTAQTQLDKNFETKHNLVNRTEVVAIVTSSDSAIKLERKAARWGYGLKSKEYLSSLDYYLLTFDCPPGIDPHVASREIEAMETFVTVEVNHKYKLQTSPVNDLNLNARIYADQLVNWPKDGCTSSGPIGMIDSAVDRSRKSLNPDKILVGNGRLKDTRLYSAEVIAKDETGELYSGITPLLKAIDWHVKSGVKIVNISLAGPYNKTLERAIDRATERGVIIVAAVGNAGPDSEPLYPAALDNVIAATAIGHDQNIYSKAVQGTHVDFAAPGVDVYVGNKETGRYITGTSIAAPFIVARIATDPTLIDSQDLSTIKSQISKTATDLGDKGRDPIYGDGLVNIETSCK